MYGDLKPENIVITEPGHIKLTDFGGCRPVTAEAKRSVGTIAKGILKNLRNGDWKDSPIVKTPNDDDFDEIDSSNNDTTDDNDEWVDDTRLEGTTAYLPPEVVMGKLPTFAADAWALGCVIYQCLAGRPPLLETDDTSTRNRIVKFDSDQNLSDVDQLFIDKHAAGITPDARDMIKLLLERDPSKRPSMHQLAEHTFFASTNVYILYSQPAYPLDVGTVGPSPDEKWARRQFSSIWAPQPEAYDISALSNSTNKKTRSTRSSTDRPIIEGEEVNGYFSISGKITPSEMSTGPGKRNRRVMLPPSYE